MSFSLQPASFQRARVALLASVMALPCTAVATAQTAPPVKNTYVTLSLPGVIGDFTTVPNAPTNSIQLLSLSTSANISCAGTVCSAPTVSALSLQKYLDDASPSLFLSLVSATNFPTATINFWQAPTSGTSYTLTYTIYLTNAKIVSLQASGAQGSSPSEIMSLSFATIAYDDNVSGAIGCYNLTTHASSSALTC